MFYSSYTHKDTSRQSSQECLCKWAQHYSFYYVTIKKRTFRHAIWNAWKLSFPFLLSVLMTTTKKKMSNNLFRPAMTTKEVEKKMWKKLLFTQTNKSSSKSGNDILGHLLSCTTTGRPAWCVLIETVLSIIPYHTFLFALHFFLNSLKIALMTLKWRIFHDVCFTLFLLIIIIFYL